MPAKNADGRYFCESCTERYSGKGECAACEGEPLLDLADEGVRQLVRDFDERRWRVRSTQWTFASLVLVAPLGLGTMWLVSLKAGLVVWGVTVAGLSGVLIKKFAPEPKLPELTPEEIRRFETDGDLA